MKKIVLVVAVALMLCISSSMVEAYIWGTDYPFTDDATVIYDRYSWNGVNHVNLTTNYLKATASATEINPNGVPVGYYWADEYATYFDTYYSANGYNWYYSGKVYK
jgi:hypothetical protein